MSKYVMSGAEEEEGRPQVRQEVGVEFREAVVLEEEDDFEVEFSAAAKSNKSAVNKISAMTFQEIGRSGQGQAESYVMGPGKSWSSVVGRGLGTAPGREQGAVAPGAGKEAGKLEEEEKVRKGDLNPYDRIKAKLKEGKEELTEEEREVVRVKRRERRKREKENKKKEKESSALAALLAPQTSKLHLVSQEALAAMNSSAGKPGFSTNPSSQAKGIKFEDEEYPDLGLAAARHQKKEKVRVVIHKEIRDESGRLCSDRESNSEWETDDEHKDVPYPDDTLEDNADVGAVIVVSEPGPISYSSILKAKKAAEVLKPKGVIATTSKMREEIKTAKVEEVEKKKVKKKDPIEFDLFTALNVKQKQAKKGQVLGGKIKKETAVKVVRNQLDSSAPSKKRGKEREGGKKKKKTLLKKIILAERLRKKLAREEAEQRREERIKAGVFLKPLDVANDDFTQVPETEIKTEPSEPNVIKTEDLLEENIPTNLEEIIPTKVELVKVETVKEESLNEPDVLEEAPKELSVEERAKLVIHTRKFRSYCSQLLSSGIDEVITTLMQDLLRYQVFSV